MTEAERLSADFLSYLEAVRQLSPHTVDAYRRDLKKLTAGVGALKLTEITPPLIRRQLAADRKAHPASLARRLAAWRAFFDYLIDGDMMTTNPARVVNAPKKPARLPKALTADEVSALLSAGEDNDALLRCRDLAMFELFYSSALRLSELWRLNVNDIDLNAGVVYVQQGKGGRGRVVPVGKIAQEMIVRWLKERKQWLAGTLQTALFISRRRSRLSTRAIQQRLDMHVKQRGFPRRLSPHALRHSCASHFLQSSGDLRATQELLGHQNIASTQIYTRLDFQHLAKVYDKAHPRARSDSKDNENTPQ